MPDGRGSRLTAFIVGYTSAFSLKLQSAKRNSLVLNSTRQRFAMPC